VQIATAAQITGVARQTADLLLKLNQSDELCIQFSGSLCKTDCMRYLLRLLFVLATRFFYSRRDLLLENLALQQQLSVFKERHPLSKLAIPDKLFWMMLRRLWPEWKRALIFVQPETVVRLAWCRTQVVVEEVVAASHW
jgi:hypothetical protein